jgi:ribonuclease R
MTKSRKDKDPFADREAKKYDEPIPSREFILQILEQAGEPVDYPSLCEELRLHSEPQREALRRRLIAMGRDGQLISNRRGVFGLPTRMELIKGRIQGNKDGYGFFVPADGSEDLTLSPLEMQKVFDGDTVLARVAGLDRRGRKEGMIVEILQRGSSQLVGRYYSEQGFGLLIPDNRRISHEIIIPEGQNKGAKDGQFVVGEITTWPSERLKPVAKIVEVLGDMTTPGMEIEIAVRCHDIPHQWPKAVLKQSAHIPPPNRKDDYFYRVDLRQLPFVTIDGEDAKDFDDAVYARRDNTGGWILYVAIADVSHYVAIASALDMEASKRGNSVYFPGYVIPMLPEALSNELCSLKPRVDRLVMVCEMNISATGELENYRFFESVIYSHARLTYTEVADILVPPETPMAETQQARMRKRHEALVEPLETLYALYHQLRIARIRNGALDFDTTETRIVFGENRKIKEIIPVLRNDAHRLIEECMLCANVATAKLLEQSQLPVLYRVHEGPNAEKLQNLRTYLRELGLTLTGGDRPRPRDYQMLLKDIVQRPDAHVLQTMVIRSLMQAVYQPGNVGHFGLSYAAYTHFTSPIRRYPDLLVHRAIRHLIRGKSENPHLLRVSGAPTLHKSAGYPYSAGDVQVLGEMCSMSERRADAASYDVIDWLKCEYFQNRLGDEFDGTVSSVTGFGLFVELNDVYIEGLLHITSLDNDYYHFDPVRHLLKGERSGKTYQLGDAVRVRVAAVNIEDRKIDLVLASAKAGVKKCSRDNSGRAGKRSAKQGRSHEGHKHQSRKQRQFGAGNAKAPAGKSGEKFNKKRKEEVKNKDKQIQKQQKKNKNAKHSKSKKQGRH